MKEKKSYKTFILVIIFSFLSMVIVSIFWMHHQLTMEDYCITQAQQIVTKYGDAEVSVTEADRKQAPGAVNTAKIYRGFSEELKCERQHLLLGIF